ncbi:MAG TPA: amidohydrolase family protein, partial [Firmicutes bacterium]|nr:amidohydrolase family protein [Bacillota bacterium]
WDLDPVSGDHPVLLVRSCGHMAVANSEALRRAGVTKETPDPPGGLIERREGEPTGVLKEAAMDLLDGVAVHTREEQEAALRLAAQEYLRLGVTAAQDMSGADAEGPAVLQDLVAGGRLGWRVCFSLIGLPPSGGRVGAGNRVLEAGIHTGLGDHWVRLGPCKALLDGSDDGATAAMYRPYRDGSGTGISYWQDEELREWATAAAARGWQVALHAIGDRAIDQAISALSAATAAATSTAAPDTAVTAGAGAAAGAAGEGRTAGVKGRAWRHRIEHCLYPTPEAVATIISCRFVPVVQPIFLSMMDEGYLNLVDPETLRLGFPVRTFLRAGLPVAAGSDAPVADPNPLAGMAEAIDRATAGGIPFRPEEAVSLEEAIAMYTRHAAWAAHWEEALGSLEPGKLADLVVLTEDIFSLPPHELRQVRVYLTVVGGRIVYSSSR